MKECVITMLKEMVEYSINNQNGNCAGFDVEYVKSVIEDLEKEN